MFDPMDNSSPLLDILEQEMAMRVSGNVSVYIENNGDVSRLNHKIKVIRNIKTPRNTPDQMLRYTTRESYSKRGNIMVILIFSNKKPEYKTPSCKNNIV